jgi:hypothetical protein
MALYGGEAVKERLRFADSIIDAFNPVRDVTTCIVTPKLWPA